MLRDFALNQTVAIGLQLFSGLTLFIRLHNVGFAYLRYFALFIVPTALVGVFGLVSLPAL